MGRLDNKVCIVTGSNSGVGAATAELFASEGAKVVITARRQELLDAEAEKIKAAGGISSFDDAEKFISLGASRLGTSRIVKLAKNEQGSGY